MTQRTRYFLVGSSMVVMVVLATGLVAYYNGNLPLSSTPSEFSYMPAESTAVAYADVRAIMGSDFRQKLRQVLPTGEETDRLKQEIGVDIEHDIDSVVAGFTGSDPSKGGAVVLVRGRFNDAQIETIARQHGATLEEYKGKRMLLMAGDSTVMKGEYPNHTFEHPTAGVAFIEPGLLALGDAASIKRAIDTASSGNDFTKNTDLMKLVDDVRGANTAWVVGRFDEISQANIPAEVKEHLPAVQFFAVSAHVNGGLSGTLRADARDEQSATDLKAVITGGLAAGRLMAGQDAKANSILNSIQVGGTNKTVTLAFTVPPELLDVLNGVAAAHRLGTGGGVHK